VTLGAIGRCGVTIAASVAAGVIVVAPPLVRGVGVVGRGLPAGPTNDYRCDSVSVLGAGAGRLVKCRELEAAVQTGVAAVWEAGCL
jgi:hypothetical protein